jgi:hypothetical protein
MSYSLLRAPNTFASKWNYDMIIERLIQAVNEIQSRMEKETKRLEAIQSIRKLLSEIDFNAEVVPTEDKDKLIRCLVSLKGRALAKNELELINELVNK